MYTINRYIHKLNQQFNDFAWKTRYPLYGRKPCRMKGMKAVRHELTELQSYLEEKTRHGNVHVEKAEATGLEKEWPNNVPTAEESESVKMECKISEDDVLKMENCVQNFLEMLKQDLQHPAVILDNFRSRMYRELVSYSEELQIGLLALIAYNSHYGDAGVLSDNPDVGSGSWRDYLFVTSEDLPF